jgi:polyisoprenoid-binding protein YceI
MYSASCSLLAASLWAHNDGRRSNTGKKGGSSEDRVVRVRHGPGNEQRFEDAWLLSAVPKRLAIFCLLLSAVFPCLSRAQAPVFEVIPVHSSIKFDVKASIDIKGKFDKWNANLTFESPDETTGSLEINVDASSVDTGSGMKNGTLKSKDFFDVERNPQITFKSTKFVQTGPDTFEVDGDFTIRGVTNPEKLTLVVTGKGTGSSEIKGKMVFNRKNYGMNKGIMFVKIADHVEVNFHLKAKRVSGPPLALKQ